MYTCCWCHGQGSGHFVKRKRINSAGKSETTATSKDTSHIQRDLERIVEDIPSQPIISKKQQETESSEGEEMVLALDTVSNNIPWLLNEYPADKPLPEGLVGKKVRFNDDNTTTHNTNNTDAATGNTRAVINPINNNSPSTLQEGDQEFLQIPEDAQPFFKRSRGCLSAASRADCRASHLEDMVEREISLPWALRLEPIPAYLMAITPQLIRIQKRNAIALQREAAKLLRRSCTHLTTQGTLNWNIVANFYGKDDTGLTQARIRMDSMVAKDFTREQDKLEEKKNYIWDHPVTNETITENLKIRGYFNPNGKNRGRSPTRAKPAPPPPADNQGVERGAHNDREGYNNHPPAADNNYKPPNRGKRRRSNSRSRSRSPNRGRAPSYNRNYQRPSNRGTGRGRGRGQQRQRGYPDRDDYYQGHAPNMPDPDQLGAIIRQVVEQFNNPPPAPTYRGRNYRR